MMTIVLVAVLFSVTGIAAQDYSQIAETSIGYVKAGTFGKPSVIKKTDKVALGQLRVHYKVVTSRSASANRQNSVDVTVYLDSPVTEADLQALTNEFYGTLRSKLASLNISMASFDDVKKTEYYAQKMQAQDSQRGMDRDGGSGQAWVSINAFDGPVFFKWRPEGAPEIVGYGQQKKFSKTSEEIGDLMMVDIVLDFATIRLSSEVKQDRQGWLYGDPYIHSEYNIGGMISIPKSYIYLANAKNGFDMYQSISPIASPVVFAEKPREDASKASYKTQAYFPGERRAFTPIVIPATRERYLSAARQALNTYADILVTKFRLLRGGEQANKKTAEPAKAPVDNKTTLENVNAEAKKANSTTAITRGERLDAIKEAKSKGQYRLAADYYTSLIKDYPNEGAYYFERGIIYINNLNDQKAAMNDMNEAIKLMPGRGEPYYNRGVIYTKSEDWKKAKKEFDMSIQNGYETAEVYLNRGICSIYGKKYDEALADFDQGLRLNPRLGNLYKAKALVYRAQGTLQPPLPKK